MKELRMKNKRARVSKVRSLIESAGNRLFSVHFITRGDGSKRRMVGRRHVTRTQYAGRVAHERLYNPKKYDLLTIFSVNDLRYNKRGGLNGRGAWKSIPLDSVTRVKVGGEIYRIE